MIKYHCIRKTVLIEDWLVSLGYFILNIYIYIVIINYKITKK